MKTFFKLFIAVAALGIVTANAQQNGGNSTSAPTYTTGQAAAIKAVTDALNDAFNSPYSKSNAKSLKAVICQKVAEFPELAAHFVDLALSFPGVIRGPIFDTVSAAAFTAPDQLASILIQINRPRVVIGSDRSAIANVLSQSARGHAYIGDQLRQAQKALQVANTNFAGPNPVTP